MKIIAPNFYQFSNCQEPQSFESIEDSFLAEDNMGDVFCWRDEESFQDDTDNMNACFLRFTESERHELEGLAGRKLKIDYYF